jgi:hypothetical protein
MVTNAHSVEVEVGADGRMSTLPSGAATAAPPAGACSPFVGSDGTWPRSDAKNSPQIDETRALEVFCKRLSRPL